MKVTLSKEELEREALAEIRTHAGCETVKAVDVEYTDLRADTNWTMFAFSEGGTRRRFIALWRQRWRNFGTDMNCALRSDPVQGGRNNAPPGLLTSMSKKIATADELIWLFHEKLAVSDFPNARIAVIPIGDGNWSALTNPTERRQYPDLAKTVARIEKQLRVRFLLRED